MVGGVSCIFDLPIDIVTIYPINILLHHQVTLQLCHSRGHIAEVMDHTSLEVDKVEMSLYKYIGHTHLMV